MLLLLLPLLPVLLLMLLLLLLLILLCGAAARLVLSVIRECCAHRPVLRQFTSAN